MRTTVRLLEAVKDIWARYSLHPFVRGSGMGTWTGRSSGITFFRTIFILPITPNALPLERQRPRAWKRRVCFPNTLRR